MIFIFQNVLIICYVIISILTSLLVIEFIVYVNIYNVLCDSIYKPLHLNWVLDYFQSLILTLREFFFFTLNHSCFASTLLRNGDYFIKFSRVSAKTFLTEARVYNTMIRFLIQSYMNKKQYCKISSENRGDFIF